MAPGTSSMAAFSKGDVVWVLAGNQHEEPATVLETGCEWTPSAETTSDKDEEKKSGSPESRLDGVLVQFNVSKVKQVYPPDRVRPLEDETTKGGCRRSRRTAAATTVTLATAADSVETTVVDAEQTDPSPFTAKSESNVGTNDKPRPRRSAVTPSPSTVKSSAKDLKGEKKHTKEKKTKASKKRQLSVTDEVPEEEAPRKKARKQTTKDDAGRPERKKAPKKKPDASSPYFEKTRESGVVRRFGYAVNPFSQDEEVESQDEEVESQDEDEKVTKTSPAPMSARKTKGEKVVSTEDKKGSGDGSAEGGKSEEEPEMEAKKTSKAKSERKPAPKKKKAILLCVPIQDNSENEGESGPVAAAALEGDDDDEDRPYSVGYAPSGRASCRRCDDVIAKGSVRISHQPLFRGKPGFTVYRHLKCAVFENVVHQAQDVSGWSRLKKQDLNALVQRIEDAKKEQEAENEELQPDELVQTVFSGEIRPSPPPGVVANLLPFQIEGFSWMRHQEVNDDVAVEGSCRGGILADEMGMGKTLQTIATMCDNRPLLQHCRPGMKHAPDAPDFLARLREESLWEKAAKDWNHELKMNDIPKKMTPKQGGSRAGTLVVCPVIALLQWKSEIEKFTEEGSLSVGIYHGPNRNSEMPPDMMRKYDVVLTTYQCMEQDFRKMMSPNKVSCPNCGAKYKIDKLRVHLKYFCGEGAQRTEAQQRQRRSSNHRAGPSASRGSGIGKGKSSGKKSDKGPKTMTPTPPAKKKTIRLQSTPEYDSDSDLSLDENIKQTTSARRPSRSAAKQASTKLAASVKEWGGTGKPEKSEDGDDDSSFGGPGSEDDESMPPSEASDESEDDVPVTTLARKKNQKAKGKPAPKNPPSPEPSESSDDSEDDIPITSLARKSNKKATTKKRSATEMTPSSDEEDEDPVARIKEKQRKALANAKKGKGSKKGPMQTSKGKKGAKAKQNKKGKPKGKNKKFDSGSDDDDDDDDDEADDPLAGIDMKELAGEAMTGAKFSILHSFCWWRIVLDEAHYIKSRSSQTAAAAFSLTGIHRWCCSGTPLQNRVGELYSLIRFLQLDPMGHYFCRGKGCDCKSVHYRIKEGICRDCGHRSFVHYSHFNRYILNVIQREGYTGDGRRAMFRLKNEVLDKCLLRRTKETRAEDMNLPPRIVNIKTLRLHPIEEDFYNALYTQTRSSFNDYVSQGTLLNNYAHIFDLLTKMRQAVDHPYLIVYSKNAKIKGLAPKGPVVANGSVDCEICHEPPTDRMLSSCCGSGFCRSCVEEYIGAAGGESTPCPCCEAPFSINLNQKPIETDLDDGNLEVTAPAIDSSTVPTLKKLSHVQSGSILRRINLAEFATSTKIETLIQDLIEMRQERPGSKALVFSQFVNMLDLIRWRLHSDPCLAHMGLGVRILHGGMDVKSRDQAIREFREDPTVRVLLMSLKAGGVALNLTVASEVFLVDNWWNPAAEMQAIDRTHRLGQHRPIRATRYICEGTVEERVLQLQEKKRLVFDGTVGRDAGSLKALSVDDMKALFT